MESTNYLTTSAVDFGSSFLDILNIIFKDCPDGIVFKDKNLRYMVANDIFCKYFDIKDKNSFLGKKSIKFLSLENQKLVNSVNNTILNEQEPISYIMSLNSDTSKILSITSTPIFFKKEFLGIISMLKDITYEECVKEEFVSKHFEIKSLLENIPMIIYMLDKNLNYVAGTKPSKDFVKLGYDAFSNIYIDKLKLKKEDDNENKYVLKNKKILIKEKEIFDNNERKHWYKIYKVPIKDVSSDVSGIITLANNIDAEKQLEAQRETFVASLGHDLKNPTIAQIRGLELLLKGDFGELNIEQKELLEMVLDSCRYMNGMLSSLLATYRNSDGVVKLNFQEFSFLDLVNECVSEMIYVAKDKNIRIDILNKMESNLIKADRVQIKRVIMNLLSNGIKYAYSNTILKLTIYKKNDKMGFKFKNRSPYIPEEKRKTIFGQYVSYASAHKELGIGLGLYASKKIIDGHSGAIFIHSEIEDINSFGFEIPINPNNNSIDNLIYF